MTDGKIINYKSEAFDYEFELIIKDTTKRGNVFMDAMRKLGQAQVELEHVLAKLDNEEKGLLYSQYAEDMEEISELKREMEYLKLELEESKAEVEFYKDETRKRDIEIQDVKGKLSKLKEYGTTLENFIGKLLK